MSVSRHTIFLEKQFIQDSGIGKQIKLDEKVSQAARAKDQVEPNQVEPIRTLPPPPRRSERVSRPPERYLGIISEDGEEMFLIGNGAHGDDPKTYNEAISDLDSEKWLEAMKSEIDSMHSNQV